LGHLWGPIFMPIQWCNVLIINKKLLKINGKKLGYIE